MKGESKVFGAKAFIYTCVGTTLSVLLWSLSNHLVALLRSNTFIFAHCQVISSHLATVRLTHGYTSRHHHPINKLSCWNTGWNHLQCIRATRRRTFHDTNDVSLVLSILLGNVYMKIFFKSHVGPCMYASKRVSDLPNRGRVRKPGSNRYQH